MGLQDAWGPLVAWYLFLAGTGAGAYMIGVIADHMGGRYKPVAKIGICLGAPMVVVGAILLLLDLGHPARFLLAFLNPQSSMISIGIIIISVFILLGFIHMAMLIFNKKNWWGHLWLGRINFLFALGTTIYTGLLLGLLKAVPFWNTLTLPILFFISALSTGVGAIMVGLGFWRWIQPSLLDIKRKRVMRSSRLLNRIDIPIILIEVFVLFFYVLFMVSSSGVAVVSANYLLSGDYALAFWMGVVVIGLLVPILLEIWVLGGNKSLNQAQILDLGVISGLCLLFGGVVLRYAILAAGANVSSVVSLFLSV